MYCHTISEATSSPSVSSVQLPHFSQSFILYINTHPGHKDTIDWDLWAEFVSFIGPVVLPSLTTGRPTGCRPLTKFLSKVIRDLIAQVWVLLGLMGFGLWTNRLRTFCILGFCLSAPLEQQKHGSLPESATKCSQWTLPEDVLPWYFFFSVCIINTKLNPWLCPKVRESAYSHL